jgi:hypothetical protein
VGSRTGTSTPTGRDRPPRARIALLSTFVVLAVLGWVFLVLAAIGFGREARSGTTGAWRSFGFAAGGAAICLFLAIVLGAWVVGLVRQKPRPVRVPGRRVAR